MQLRYSFIVPVYNRPQEIVELLDSLDKSVFPHPFEIVVVEDGSSLTAEEQINAFRPRLDISYYYKENTGPGHSRNYGMQRAKGTYFIILDSDCLVPANYLETVSSFLNQNYVDCYGGADAAHPSFSKLQKAINYVMTSFLTTGGIRGNKNAIQDFEPRSFNMGISKEAFEKTGGFGKIHPGEDPDLSQRIKKEGFQTAFIPDAYVYHKRRITWKGFYTQVRKFGLVRPILNSWHPSASKPTFWLPSVFVGGSLLSLVLAITLSPLWAVPLCLYVLLIGVDSALKNSSATIGFYAMGAVFIQFYGYGIAFMESTYHIRWLKKDPKKKFPQLFF
ncbi:MAG: glycosyl transferase family 2 [Flavobacteriaceae bacterium]|nr:glycosyl transferase family 2 [Flavobacteriaceae bacterium]